MNYRLSEEKEVKRFINDQKPYMFCPMSCGLGEEWGQGGLEDVSPGVRSKV